MPTDFEPFARWQAILKVICPINAKKFKSVKWYIKFTVGTLRGRLLKIMIPDIDAHNV